MDLNNFDINLYYKNNILYVNNFSLQNLAEKFGTPLFIYDYKLMKENFLKYSKILLDNNIKHLICFAMKTNFNSRILKEFAALGSGFDTVSGGEIYKALNIGGDNKKIVYAGIGKTKQEIGFAIKNDILMFNVESKDELLVINEIAKKLDKEVRIAFRINPDVDPKTHPYISTGLLKNKFGIDINEVVNLYVLAKDMENILPVGIHCHIGSQILDISPYFETIDKIFLPYKKLKNLDIDIEYINIGGGLGISYNNTEKTLDPKYLLNDILLENIKKNNLTLILEPGRSLIGNAGILLTKVLYHKTNKGKKFLIVDTGMNDLCRPSLYNAYHEIIPLQIKNNEKDICDIVGPICESGDFLAKDREINKINNGDFLAVLSSGAYCQSMSSNYNSRLKSAEILLKGNEEILIRKRDEYKDLLLNEL